MEEDSALRRSLLTASLVPLVVLILSGCGVPFVPVEPNRLPLWMMIHDGVAEFLWCGDATEAYDRLLVEYLVYSEPRQEGQLADGSGSYSLQTGERFSTVSPPGDAIYTMTAPLPSSQDLARIFVYGGRAPDDLTWNVIFEPGTLEDFAADTWLSPGGDRESEPCSSTAPVDVAGVWTSALSAGVRYGSADSGLELRGIMTSVDGRGAG